MPGFSQWARTTGVPEAKAAEESYVVINDLLKSKRAKGLRFRRSPKINDMAPGVAAWGSTVRGVPHGPDWLKVGDLYLPICVSGKCVLLRDDDDLEDQLEKWQYKDRRKELYRRFGQWDSDDERVSEDDDPEAGVEAEGACGQAETQAVEEKEEEEEPEESYEHDDYILDQEGKPLLPDWRSREDPKAPAPEGSPAQRLLSVLCGEEFAGQPNVPGQPYQVLEDQEMRQVPSRKARVFGKVVKNQRLLLYKWDATGRWRTIWQDFPLRCWLWLEVGDPEAGPLMRPVVPSATTKLRPWEALLSIPRAHLNPVCVSVFENDPGHLQSFVCLAFDLNARDAAGLTPLMLASQWGLVECCVLLLRGGASGGLAAPDGRKAAEFGRDAPTRALIEALLGKETFDAQAFEEAMQKLRPELQDVAEQMLEEVTAAQQEKRRREREAVAELARIKALEAKLLAERGADGARFEAVAAFVVMRQDPSVDSPMLGELPKGRVVELFDWSLDAKWRKCWHPMVTRRPPVLYTWVMLDDPDRGPQLRPYTATTEEVLRPWRAADPTCRVPLQPVCTAVHENNVGHLQNLAIVGADVNAPDYQGFSPLMLAAKWGLYDCCVRLLHDGANALQKNPEGEKASDLANQPDLKALIKWLSGEDPKVRCYSVLERLAPDLQECAETILKNLAAKREAQRKAQEEADAEARRKQERERAEEAARMIKAATPKDVYNFDFLAERPSAYTLAELDELRAKKDFEDQEAKMAQGLLEAWTCSDCAFQSPASSPVCVFCDTPRGGGVKEAHLQGKRVP